jgi:hypothetical protein
MSSPLAKRRPFFSVEKQAAATEPRRTVVGLPFAPEQIRQLVVVVEKQNGEIDVAGPIHEAETCVRLMKAGMVRVVDYAERTNKADIEIHHTLPPGLRDAQ